MKLTKQQKIYGAVMVLAGGAFIWDRATSGPAKVEGQTPADLLVQHDRPAAMGAPSLPLNSTGTASPSGAQRGVEQRLAAVAGAECLDPSSADDAFALSAMWRAKRLPEPADPGPSVKPIDPRADREMAAAFIKRHQLGAVMVRGNRGYAIIDKTGVFVGQTYDHFKLLSVTKTAAVFACGEVRVELRLEGSATLKGDGGVIENAPEGESKQETK